MSFLKNPNNLTFFITPTTVKEVNDLISNPKANKSTRHSRYSGNIKRTRKDIEKDDLCKIIVAEMQKVILIDSDTVIQKVLSGLIQSD